MSRVVVTAASILCPLGTRWDAVSQALRDGRSGIGPITAFDATQCPAHVAGQVPGWRPHDPTWDRTAAMLHALVADLPPPVAYAPVDRVGVVLGVGRHGLALTPVAPSSPGWWPPEEASARVAAWLGASGPARTLSTACASGNDAIGHAVRLLRRGRADVVVCGAADAQVAPVSILEFHLLRALAPSDGPAQPRPFDRDRAGFVIGEGGALFVLETLEHAACRGARALAEVAGYGAAQDAHALTRGHPDQQGAIAAMRLALRDAALDPADIDHVNTHGTATRANDAAEAAALRAVFGPRTADLPVAATKSLTGHLIAAAAAVEAAFAVMALAGQFVPPTRNCDAPDPECGPMTLPPRATACPLRHVMSNAFGFGGHNAVVVLGRAPS